MALSERDRRNIFNGFEQAHGVEFANNIMELLPKQPADQLVTRTDMHAFGTELRGEMAELRGDLRGEMTELRGEMAELRGEMAGLRGEMIERFATAKIETQRLIIAGMAANSIAVITALIA